MDFESRVLIFMFFNCTMVRDIHTMGKILLPYTLEILTHPSALVKWLSDDIFNILLRGVLTWM